MAIPARLTRPPPRPSGVLRRLSLAALVLTWAAAPVRAVAKTSGDADAEYQSGVEQYSRGRFTHAERRFQAALRLDPRHRAARVALERIRVEHPGTELPSSASPPPPLSSRPRGPEEHTPLALLAQAFYFERTFGDAADDQGLLQAMQGRILQWECERRVARARGRIFVRLAELRALSRRLPAVLS